MNSPSISTWWVGQIPANKSLKKTKPQNINQFCGFFSCLKMTTQDRHRTEKRPQQTLIRYILVTQNPDMGLCNECVTKMPIMLRCSSGYKILTRT